MECIRANIDIGLKNKMQHTSCLHSNSANKFVHNQVCNKKETHNLINEFRWASFKKRNLFNIWLKQILWNLQKEISLVTWSKILFNKIRSKSKMTSRSQIIHISAYSLMIVMVKEKHKFLPHLNHNCKQKPKSFLIHFNK